MENCTVCSLFLTWTSVTEGAHAGQLKHSNQKNRKVAMKPNETFNNRISRRVSYASAMQVPKQSHYNLKSMIVEQLG